MIEQLVGHITQNQIDSILKVIIYQYKKYLKLTDGSFFQELFRDEYAPHNKQFGISWAISSGFPSGDIIAENLHITRQDYGRGHRRPVFDSESIRIHVLNKTTDFNAEYLKECYALNSLNFTGRKLYCYIRFETGKRKLKSISLCLPDAEGNVVVEDILLDTNDISRLAA